MHAGSSETHHLNIRGNIHGMQDGATGTGSELSTEHADFSKHIIILKDLSLGLNTSPLPHFSIVCS